MVDLFVLSYWAVFLPEVLGDRCLYTVGALVTQFRPAAVFAGIVLAFMGKALAAALFGGVIAGLPAMVVAGLSGLTFLLTAVVIWRKRPGAPPPPSEPRARGAGALATAFGSIFFSEWGDVGQVTTATLVARYHAPGLVWLAATLALVTKGGLALTLGLGLRRYVPQSALRYAALAFYIGMGILVMLRPQA